MLSTYRELADRRELCIREAHSSDAGSLIEYLERVSGQSDFLSFGPGEFSRSAAEVRSHIERCATTENMLQLVGEVDSNVVACLTFEGGVRPRTAHIGELGMSVDQAFWGLGIGGMILDRLIDWARASSVVAKLNLRVAVNNPRAQRLYESRGFKREGTISRDMLINGQFVDHDLMGLQV